MRFTVPTLLVALLATSTTALAAPTVGTVQQASQPTQHDVAGMTELVQQVVVSLPNHTLVQVEHSDFVQGGTAATLQSGDRVVVDVSPAGAEVVAPYRLDGLVWMLAIFVGLAWLVAGRRVWRSVLSLGVALGALTFGIAPLLLAGYPPIPVALGGSVVIAAVTFTLTHGWRLGTLLGLVATLGTLTAAVGLASLAIFAAQLSGFGSEEALYLNLGMQNAIDMRGLLLAGILIGTLGVLDDVTMTQIETVAELHTANPNLTPRELVSRAMMIGRTHISSVINTLALAYAGAGLPLFLLFGLSPQPLWITLNSELVMEELIRMLVGSSALVLAIPLATVLAAWQAKHLKRDEGILHVHHHH